MSERALLFSCEGGRAPSDATFVRRAATAPGFRRVARSDGDWVLQRAGGGAGVVDGIVFDVSLADLGDWVATAGESSPLEVVALGDGSHALARVATAEPNGERSTWDHTSLAVRDLAEAVAFYRELFGFEVEFSERGMTGQIAGITGLSGLEGDIAQLRSPASDHVLELIAFRGAPAKGGGRAPVTPGMGHVALSVGDLRAALATVERLGGSVLGEITRFEDGDSAYCREPAGSFLEISARRRP